MEDHMEFRIDPSGMPLRYKILIKDMAVNLILYNTEGNIQEVPHEEIRMRENDRIEVSGHNLGDLPIFGEIIKFPVGMLVCRRAYRAFADTIEESRTEYAIHGDCHHRSPERLPGYIDIHVWS